VSPEIRPLAAPIPAQAPSAGGHPVWAGAALVVSVAAILAATLPWDLSAAGLRPEESPIDPPLDLADTLRNVVLFVPLGASLAWLGLGAGRAAVLGAALSLAVEIGQLLIPGRDASPRDLLANTAGTLLGFLLVRRVRDWLAPAPALQRTLVFAAGLLAAALFAAAGPLYVPSPTEETWYGHWTPQLGHLAHYAGRVEAASFAGLPVVHGALAATTAMHERFRGDFELHVSALSGPPPPDVAPILLVTDELRSEILLLGPDGDDLALRYRSQSDALGLEPARLRLPGILAGLEPGRPLELSVTRRGGDLCVAWNAEQRCGLGFTAGDLWQLLGPDYAVLAPWRRPLAALWVAMLCVPIGLWARRDAVSLLAVGVAAAALLLAGHHPALLPTPPVQLAGAAAGFGVGVMVRRLAAGALLQEVGPR
jgi:VanZ family protein